MRYRILDRHLKLNILLVRIPLSSFSILFSTQAILSLNSEAYIMMENKAKTKCKLYLL